MNDNDKQEYNYIHKDEWLVDWPPGTVVPLKDAFLYEYDEESDDYIIPDHVKIE